ncbi:DUF4238 domain-containing protein [Ancylomarina longa]|uniref:DUF4238 domain-containing protein n=1 Tax=Ancylomarina longa TaxID=2487017 RepID=A0A434AUE9_9BACT|nr:DUF4238 domain-containing protein [Ancylomarina longa]RUT78050.1 DUF4238 domain-containing protein [Ancylomarina longa]
MRQKNERQHYVPQCYLRNFSENGKNLYTYDKIIKKSFCSSTGKVAYEDFFYDLPKKYIRNIEQLPFAEKYFEKEFFSKNVEVAFSSLLSKIITKATNWKISNLDTTILDGDEKSTFAYLIVIQYLRNIKVRNNFSTMFENLAQQSADIIASTIDSNLKVKASLDKEFEPVLHSDIYADPEFLKNCASDLLKKHWVYYVSSDNDFITSDNPVLLKPHLQNQRRFNEGFGMSGVEIILPISPSVLLTIWDSEHHKDKLTHSDKFISEISMRKKREYNMYQYLHAHRQVFSKTNNFELIKLLENIIK